MNALTPRPLARRSCGPLPGTLAIAAALLAAWCTAWAGHSLPLPLTQEGFSARQVGGGLLTWFGLDIYEASLWTVDGTFTGLAPLAQPTALSLWYKRGFSRERLIEITQSGWTEFNLAGAQQQERWSAQLAKIWVDAEKGSNMTALVMPGGETRFYSAQRHLGSVADPAFGPAFLGIWLDERTRGTRLENLRTALLGHSAASCKNSARHKLCPQQP